jgi:hypothetical protein
VLLLLIVLLVALLLVIVIVIMLVLASGSRQPSTITSKITSTLVRWNSWTSEAC